MFEVSESQYKPVEWQETVELGGRRVPQIVAATIEGALSTKLIQASDEIVSIFHRRCVLRGRRAVGHHGDMHVEHAPHARMKVWVRTCTCFMHAAHALYAATLRAVTRQSAG